MCHLTRSERSPAPNLRALQGDDDTFAGFPQHLRALLGHALPKVRIVTMTYPKYETRGDLKECVGRFKEW
jgi:hypothetical protein